MLERPRLDALEAQPSSGADRMPGQAVLVLWLAALGIGALTLAF